MWTKYIILIMFSICTGAIGTILFQQVNPPRPDPFTGTMGKILRHELQQQIDVLNIRIEECLNLTAATRPHLEN